MTWQFHIFHRFTGHLVSSTSLWLHPEIHSSPAPLQNTGASCVSPTQPEREMCYWTLLAAGSETGNSIWAKNKKNITSIARKEVCHSLCVCIRVLGHRGAAHPNILHKHSTYTHTHTHTHTLNIGFITCQHFLEVSPPRAWGCQPKVFLFSTLLWSHVNNFHDGRSSASLSFVGEHKVKRGKDPDPELSASLCHLVTSQDNIPDLQHSQNTHMHRRV